MAYKMGSADLMVLRYIHSIYTYLQHDIKLDDKTLKSLKETVKSLSKRFSGAVLDAVRGDDMVGQLKDMLQQFSEVLRLEEENEAKILLHGPPDPKKKKSKKSGIEIMSMEV